MVQVGDSIAQACGGEGLELVTSDGTAGTLASLMLLRGLEAQGLSVQANTPATPTGFFNKACAGIAAREAPVVSQHDMAYAPKPVAPVAAA